MKNIRLNFRNTSKIRVYFAVAIILAISLIGFSGLRIFTDKKADIVKEPEYLIQEPIVRAVSPELTALSNSLLSEVGLSVDGPGSNGKYYGGTSKSSDKDESSNAVIKNNFNATVQVWGVSGSGKSYEALKNVVVKFSSKNRSGDKGCGKNGSFGNKYKDSWGPTDKNGNISFVNCTSNNSNDKELGYDISLSNVPSEWSENVNRANRGMKVIIIAPNKYTFHIDVVLPNRFELVAKPVNTLPDTDLMRVYRDSKGRLNLFLAIQDEEEENRRRTELNECIKEEQLNNKQGVSGYRSTHGGGKRLKHYGRYGQPNSQVKVFDVLEPAVNLNKHRNNLNKKCNDLRYARTYIINVAGVQIQDRNRSLFRANNVGITLNFHGTGKCKNGTASPSKPFAYTNRTGTVKFSGCSRNNIDITYSNLKDLVSVNRPNYGNGSIVKVNAASDYNGQVVRIYIEFTATYDQTWRSKFNNAASAYWRERLGNGGPRAEERRYGYSKNALLGYHDAKCAPYQVDIIFYSGDERDFAKTGVRNAEYSPGTYYCRIKWNKSDSAFIKATTTDQVAACLIFVHEYGHMLGYWHHPSRDDVMFATPSVGGGADYRKAVSKCTQSRPH